jgi:hypothetical protein
VEDAGEVAVGQVGDEIGGLVEMELLLVVGEQVSRQAGIDVGHGSMVSIRA